MQRWIHLETKYMDKVNFTVDEVLYQKAKEYCRKLKPEARGDFYYALLDWCDQRKDIMDSLAKKYDKYEIVYIDQYGKSHREEFTYCEHKNTYMVARERCTELIGDNVECLELRHCHNPYLGYPYRLGELILSYERK